jgi:uncharacterized RDD family membrane protein YckC
MRWTDEMRIETPEQIGVDLELAGLGSRFVAQVVDWLWKALFSFVLLLIGAIVVGLLGHGHALEDPSKMLIALVIALLYGLWLGYAIYFELRWNGQTPGKRFAGIRVVSQNGAPIDFRAACVRNLLAIADFLPAFHLLGALLVLLTRNSQRLGDLAAGTVVIRERAVASAPHSGDELLTRASTEYAFTPTQLATLDASDRAVLRSFLQRYDGMARANRERLAEKMAETYARKTNHRLATPLPDDEIAITFLASLFRDLEEFLRRA